MANSRIYFKSEAGGTTVVSRDTTATSGNLVLPASGNVASVDTAVTDNAIARYDSTTGKLQNSAITIDDVGNIGTGAQSFNGFGGSGFKNMLINGDFRIDQYSRGSQSLFANSNPYIDRWIVFNSTLVNSGQLIQAPTGFTNMLYVTKTNTQDTQIMQRIEFKKDTALKTFNNRTFTISFWAKSNVNNFIEHIFFIKNGVSANSYEVLNFNTKNNTIANSWVRVVATINVNFVYESGDFVELRIDPANSTAGELYITGCQLEEGSIATPFESRPIGLELALCQRYYETNGNARIEEFRNVTTGILQYGAVRFMVEKRITPTIVVMADNTMVAGTVCQDNGTSVSVSIASSGTTGFRLHWTNTAGRFGASFHYTASAEL